MIRMMGRLRGRLQPKQAFKEKVQSRIMDKPGIFYFTFHLILMIYLVVRVVRGQLLTYILNMLGSA